MSRKSKGTNAERELIHMFWENGFSAVRAAGSGSMKYPCPDVLAGKDGRRIALECKSTKKDYQYLTKQEIDELLRFCTIFGAEPWIGVRFNNLEWSFLRVRDLKETEKHYAVTRDSALKHGICFDVLVKPEF